MLLLLHAYIIFNQTYLKRRMKVKQIQTHYVGILIVMIQSCTNPTNRNSNKKAQYGLLLTYQWLNAKTYHLYRINTLHFLQVLVWSLSWAETNFQPSEKKHEKVTFTLTASPTFTFTPCFSPRCPDYKLWAIVQYHKKNSCAYWILQ